jgi:hypothetical protein
MGLGIQGVIDRVENAIGGNTLASMLAYVKKQDPSLWGEIKPPSFLKHMVALTVYKDMEAIGYTALLAKLSLPYKLNHKSLQHNCQLLRKILGKWGLSTIKLGTKQSWRNAGLRVQVPKVLQKKGRGPYLWIDSSDFPRAKFKGYTKQSPWHSFKINGPGRRYMFVRDGNRKVVKLWGGYTPKLYDGHFVEDHRDEFEEKFSGATLLGDQHFSYGAKFLEEVKIVTPGGTSGKNAEIPEEAESDEGTPATSKAVFDFEAGKPIGRATKEDSELAKGIKELRARIEGVFGFLKTKFKSLTIPFQESASQQDSLVWYATGVYNMKR